MCRGKRCNLTVNPKNLQEHERDYARLIKALQDKDANMDGVGSDCDPCNPFEDFSDWVLRPMYPMLEQMAPVPQRGPQKATLAEAFEPETYHYDLQSRNGILTAVTAEPVHEDDRFWTPFMEIDASLLRADLRCIRPEDLEIEWNPETDPYPRPSRVSLGPTEHFFLKHVIEGMEPCINRECKTLLQLQDLGISDDIRVPKLHGYVQYEGERRISGLLLTRIDVQNSLSLLVFHDKAISKTRKMKWMEQIESSLEALHLAGIVWGDVKADNVLVDVEDNAWMIDFGGGYTPGWVEKEQMDSVQGDLTGLARIRAFLGLETEGI